MRKQKKKKVKILNLGHFRVMFKITVSVKGRGQRTYGL